MADRATLEKVVRVLGKAGVRDFALTGGIAFGYWVEPRHTKDVDVAGLLSEPDAADVLLAGYDGIRSGPEPIPDLVRFRVGDWDVDLFVAKSEHARRAIERAVPVEIEAVNVRVVTAEDLIVHKFVKLRTDRHRVLQDLADLRALVSIDGIDRAYIESWLDADERAVLEALASEDDDTLLRRLTRR